MIKYIEVWANFSKQKIFRYGVKEMSKNYENPIIEILNYENEVLTAGGSVVIEFPWAEGEEDFFE